MPNGQSADTGRITSLLANPCPWVCKFHTMHTWVKVRQTIDAKCRLVCEFDMQELKKVVYNLVWQPLVSQKDNPPVPNEMTQLRADGLIHFFLRRVPILYYA